MSVDVASLPAWKLALLERKRRQEMDTDDGGLLKSDGSETLGKMPPWKQEILFRKQQKRHSTGRTYDGMDGENRRSLSEILLSPEDSDRCGMETAWPVLLSPVRDTTYYGDLKTTYRLSNTAVDHTSESEHNDAPVEEERLPPVHQNPILLLDLEKRHQSGFLVSLSSPGASDSQQRSSLPSKLSKLQVNSHDDFDGSEHIECGEDQGDSVFREEEVTYGKGFVSRLLQRFSYLSGREDQPIAPPLFRSLSRGQSSEDFMRHHYDPDIRSKKRNAVRKKANSLDDLLTDGMINRSVVENGSTINGRVGREGTMDPLSSVEGHAEVRGIVLSAKSIFESLATSPTSLKNPPFVHDRQYTSASRNHETREGLRSAENHTEPNRKDLKDNASTSSVPTVSRPTFSSSHPQRPPAILGPKPVYKGNHFVSLQTAETQPKKYAVAQRSCDVVIKSTKDNTEKSIISAQTSIKTDQVAFNDVVHKTDPDHNKNTGSVAEFRSLFDSSDAKHPDHNSKDHKGHLTISAHTDEPSKVKERVPVHSTSVPAHSTSVPVPSISVQAHQTSVPAPSTSVPVPSISVPAHQTSVPAHSTSVPVPSISVPVSPISVPAHSTSVPVPPISVSAHSISVPTHVENSAVDKTHEPTHKENATAPKKPDAAAAKKPDATAAKKSGPSRPGLLLIRPASNLTTTPRTEYLQMTKYNDITKGEFAPAVKRSIHKSGGGSDDDDSDADEADGSRDRSKYLKVRFEFEGGGVHVGRSLLAKTKKGVQLKINFDDAATSTYEYPSEQSLIDCMPPEPDDVDYRKTGEQSNGKALPSSVAAAVMNRDSKVDSGPPASSSSSSSIPSSNSSSGNSTSSSTVDLSSYKSKTQVDFEFDSCSRKNDEETLALSSVDSQPNQATVAAKSDNGGVSWSDSTSSDHVLF